MRTPLPYEWWREFISQTWLKQITEVIITIFRLIEMEFNVRFNVPWKGSELLIRTKLLKTVQLETLILSFFLVAPDKVNWVLWEREHFATFMFWYKKRPRYNCLYKTRYFFICCTCVHKHVHIYIRKLRDIQTNRNVSTIY